jgi:hypothetical protein
MPFVLFSLYNSPFVKALKARKQTMDFTERGTPNFVKLMQLGSGNSNGGNSLYPFKLGGALGGGDGHDVGDKAGGALGNDGVGGGGGGDSKGGAAKAKGGKGKGGSMSILELSTAALRANEKKANQDEQHEKVDVMALLNHEKLGRCVVADDETSV